jgi:hypothetical protein
MKRNLPRYRPPPIRNDLVRGTPKQIERAITRLRDAGFVLAVSPQLRSIKTNTAAEVCRCPRNVVRPTQPSQLLKRRSPLNRPGVCRRVLQSMLACLGLEAIFSLAAFPASTPVEIRGLALITTFVTAAIFFIAPAVRRRQNRVA